MRFLFLCGARHWLTASVSFSPAHGRGLIIKFEPDAANLSSGYKNMAGHCSWPARPTVGVDGANRCLAGDDLLDLPDRFQRLALDRRRRQAADMGRGDDVRQL